MKKDKEEVIGSAECTTCGEHFPHGGHCPHGHDGAQKTGEFVTHNEQKSTYSDRLKEALKEDSSHGQDWFYLSHGPDDVEAEKADQPETHFEKAINAETSRMTELLIVSFIISVTVIWYLWGEEQSILNTILASMLYIAVNFFIAYNFLSMRKQSKERRDVMERKFKKTSEKHSGMTLGDVLRSDDIPEGEKENYFWIIAETAALKKQNLLLGMITALSGLGTLAIISKLLKISYAQTF